MKISDILKHKGSNVWTLQAPQTVDEALQLFVTHHIGALVVLDENNKQIVGVISERDIVRGCYYKHSKLDNTLVRDLMTEKVITCSPDDPIDGIMAMMTNHRVRHIPVLVEGRLQGIVSIGDVVKALLEDSAHQIQNLKEYMYGSNPGPIE